MDSLISGVGMPPAEQRARAADVPVADFDIELDPTFREDPFDRWRDAAKLGPIFSSNAARGFWVVTKYELIREITQHPEQFSSRDMMVFYREKLPFHAIPTHLDRPDHIPIRRLVQPLLAPEAIRKLEPSIRDVTRRLVDELSVR